MTVGVAVDKRVEHLPPAAKLVYVILAEADDPLTKQDLKTATRLPRSTLHNALTCLDQAGVLERQPDLRDPNRDVFVLRS